MRPARLNLVNCAELKDSTPHGLALWEELAFATMVGFLFSFQGQGHMRGALRPQRWPANTAALHKSDAHCTDPQRHIAVFVIVNKVGFVHENAIDGYNVSCLDRSRK